MKTITINLYRFEELTDEAQIRARFNFKLATIDEIRGFAEDAALNDWHFTEKGDLWND